MDALSDTLIRDYWHLVAHRSELARPGDYVRLDWPLGELALFNDEGAVIAFDNLCPHRGARYFVEDAGSGRIACPYHGWGFRDGELRIPLRQTFEAAEIAEARLNTYRTAWCGDFLFVGLAFRRLYFQQPACEPGDACARSSVLKRQRLIFWIVALVLLALLSVPWLAPLFL